jgi:predicted AlkP superfamily phosphohydrolase/phosphomutase
VYFGRLFWRSIGSVGHRKLYVYENDSGPDGANHDYHGIFIASRLNSHKKVAGAGRTVERLRLLDVTPSLLRYFGIEPPRSMQGKSIPL